MITFPFLGVPNALERGTTSAVAHKWAISLRNTFSLEGPQRFKEGDKMSGGPRMAKLAT